MKALTLHQPWASLVALGVKTIETRSWATKYRGPLAIHAGTKRVHSGHFLLLARTAIDLIDEDTERAFRRLDVPFGAVVATCTLAEVVPMVLECEEGAIRRLQVFDRSLWLSDPEDEDAPGEEDTQEVTSQRPYGDFRAGRFAWILRDIMPLDVPVPARGRQQLWEWTATSQPVDR